ncbi:hypothetical protein [Aestuariivirga sp.]|uniref:hypothetical protein n=1 Tax=Aestuariivirga sp. TaxID=2650926 RepID=UPI003BAC9A04
MTTKPKAHLRRQVSPGSSPHRKSATLDEPPAAEPMGRVIAGMPREVIGSGGPMPIPKRVHRKVAAGYIGTSLSWLDKSRLKGDGPVFLQIGGRVVYDTADLDDYLARCRRQSTSQGP